MRKAHVVIAVIVSLFSLAIAAGQAVAKSGPGPVVVGIVERVESHTKAPNSDFLSGVSKNYGSDTYLFTTLYMSRKLDDGVTGMIAYINKYGLEDNESLTDIGNITIQHEFTKHWKSSYSYSYVSNPSRAVVGRVIGHTASNWFSFGEEFNTNPGGKKKTTWKTGLTFNTATDFANGQTATYKLNRRTKINKRTDIELAYQMIYGLKENALKGVFREVYTNQYFFTLDRKVTKRDKLQFTYLFANNQYNGSKGDDTALRLTWSHTIKSK